MTRIQLFTVMFLSRVFITLLYMPKSTNSLRGGDIIFEIILAAVVLSVVAIPINKYLNDESKKGLLFELQKKGRPLQIVISLIIIAGMLIYSLLSITRFNIFATTVVFPASDLRVFLLIMVLCSFYCIFMGLGVLGRTAEIFFPFIAFSVIFVLVSTVGRFEFTNFTPALYDGIKGPLEHGLITVSSTVELFYPVFYKDRIKGGTKNFIYPWLLTTMGFLLAMVIWEGGVLGDYANTQLFPFFSLTSLSTLGFIERLDAFITSSWLVCIFIRVAIFISISRDSLKAVFPKISEKNATIVMALTVGLLVLLMRENYSSRLLLEKIYLALSTFGVIVVIIPIITLMRNKNEKDNINSSNILASNNV